MSSMDDQITEHEPLFMTKKIGLQDTTVDDINESRDKNKLPDEIIEISIYNIRTKFRRNLILLITALIAFLLPFCDTIYLPTLNYIAISLNTSITAVTLSVSIYLFMVAFCSLIWGTLSDRFGRKIIMIIALVIFVLASLVCIFAPTIAVLIVFRAVEGGSIVATLVIGQSLVGDIFPPEQRGTAAGFLFLPFNIGPIIGPLIGGPLSDAFGWRSTFVVLTIYGVANIVVLFILVPETHQYFAKENYHKANPEKHVIDAIPNEKPTFGKPWQSLIYLADFTLLPYMVLAALPFASLYTSLTLLPVYLADPPYSYTQTIIGLLYIPSGVSIFLGSIFGGWSSDKASKYYGHEKSAEGRVVPALILSVLSPVGLVIYGWIFQYQLSVVVAIIGQIFIGFSQAALGPTVSAYLTIRKQEKAAAVSAAFTFSSGFIGALLITFAVPMEDAMGSGPYFTLLASLNVVIIVIAGVLVYKSITRKGYVSM